MTQHRSTAFRSAACGDLRAADAGTHVTLAGWVHRRRDLGSLVILDLRDREGISRSRFEPAWTAERWLAEARRPGA
jgi:aspartyl-tRNA synthetase